MAAVYHEAGGIARAENALSSGGRMKDILSATRRRENVFRFFGQGRRIFCVCPGPFGGKGFTDSAPCAKGRTMRRERTRRGRAGFGTRHAPCRKVRSRDVQQPVKGVTHGISTTLFAFAVLSGFGGHPVFSVECAGRRLGAVCNGRMIAVQHVYAGGRLAMVGGRGRFRPFAAPRHPRSGRGRHGMRGVGPGPGLPVAACHAFHGSLF